MIKPNRTLNTTGNLAGKEPFKKVHHRCFSLLKYFSSVRWRIQDQILSLATAAEPTFQPIAELNKGDGLYSVPQRWITLLNKVSPACLTMEMTLRQIPRLGRFKDGITQQTHSAKRVPALTSSHVKGWTHWGSLTLFFRKKCFCNTREFHFLPPHPHPLHPTQKKKREGMGNKGQLNEEQIEKGYPIIWKRWG